MFWLLVSLGCRSPESSVPTGATPAPEPVAHTGSAKATGHTGTPLPSDTGHTGGGSATGHTGSSDIVVVPGAHAIMVSATLPAAAPLDIRCVSPADALEVHHLTTDLALTHDVGLFGLLGDTDYDCVVTGGALSAAVRVHTPVNLVETPWSIVEHDPSRSYGSYTLFNHGDSSLGDEPHELIIVDPEGRVRWEKQLPDEYPDCDVSLLLPERTILYGGGQGIAPTIETLGGDVLWQAPSQVFAERYHHHAERLPSGEVLTMIHAQDTDGIDTWEGFEILRLDAAGQTVWSWSSQKGFDDGWLPLPRVDANDPWHANSVAVDDNGITYVNLRQKHWVVAIDPAGQVLWRLGRFGDFTLVDADGTPLADDQWFFGAHAPEHHGDRILFHDNGWARPDEVPNFSRALELVLDPVARTATPTWSWEEAGWYESIWGDIDELPSDTVLVTRGHCGGCAPDQRSQYMEIHRPTGDVVWRLLFDRNEDTTYRAQRIHGCDLFHNERYCP